MSDKDTKADIGSPLMAEMMLNEEGTADKDSDLVVEPKPKSGESDSFERQLEATLKETESAVLKLDQVF